MQLLCRALHLGLDPECSSATTAGQVEGAMSASCLQRLRGTEIQVRLGQHCMQGIAYRGSAATAASQDRVVLRRGCADKAHLQSLACCSLSWLSSSKPDQLHSVQLLY